MEGRLHLRFRIGGIGMIAIQRIHPTVGNEVDSSRESGKGGSYFGLPANCCWGVATYVEHERSVFRRARDQELRERYRVDIERGLANTDLEVTNTAGDTDFCCRRDDGTLIAEIDLLVADT